jgi:hypothetical protein
MFVECSTVENGTVVDNDPLAGAAIERRTGSARLQTAPDRKGLADPASDWQELPIACAHQ